MEKFIGDVANLVWSDALVYLALGVGVYFTCMTRGVQFRYFREMLRLLRDKPPSDSGISSFQAFCMSLSGRIGVGNIAGVATAIASGGPGAVLWMNVMALLGGASAFVESTLAQVYKERVGGEYRGGSAWYIEYGLGWKRFAMFVALVVCLSYGVLVPGVQANSITTSFSSSFGISPWMTGAIIIGPLSMIIFGGVKRIAGAADWIVPFMSVGYIFMMAIILGKNIDVLPGMFRLIVGSAFGFDAVFGGMVGYSISWGVRRAVFSNVAGAGEGTYSSAAASVSHPVKQGLVQAFSVYIDTVVVCTATALMILATGKFNVVEHGSAGFIVENLPGVPAGAAFTQYAISTVFPNFGSGFVSVAIFFFAFTCLMAYYYIAETTLVYLADRVNIKAPVFCLKILFLAVVAFGCVQTADVMWGLGDIGFGSMCYLNLLVIVFLTKPVLRLLKDYERQKDLGLDPVFNPKSCEVKGAVFWSENEMSDKRSDF
ncbi:MAG: alanine/glycine:cation symporter family protein [Lautropia sp.]|nr:alanine/glycine:cation symporter family protein [Lautropia sp.]